MKRISAIAFLLTFPLTCVAQNASYDESAVKKHTGIWVRESSKKVKVDADRAIVEIQTQQENERLLAEEQITRTTEGIIKQIELFDKPFMGRIGNMCIEGCVVELFDDTVLVGCPTWKDVKVGYLAEIEYYKFGAFDHASKITIKTSK